MIIYLWLSYKTGPFSLLFFSLVHYLQYWVWILPVFRMPDPPRGGDPGASCAAAAGRSGPLHPTDIAPAAPGCYLASDLRAE